MVSVPVSAPYPSSESSRRQVLKGRCGNTLTSGYLAPYRNPYQDLWVFTSGEEPDEEEQEHERPASRHPRRADPHRALGGAAPRLRSLPLAGRPERQGAAGRGGDPLPRAVPPRAAGMDRGGMGDIRARPACPLLPADARGNAAARGRGPDLRRVRGRGGADPAAAALPSAPRGGGGALPPYLGGRAGGAPAGAHAGPPARGGAAARLGDRRAL